MNQINNSPNTSSDIIVLAVLAIIVVVTWIGLEAYQRLTTTTVPPVLQEQIASIDPQLDTEFLDSLGTKSNTKFDNFQLQLVTPTPALSLTPSPSPEATPSFTPTPTPEL